MSTREELTLQAEKCLRLGRVDDAIAHYRDLAHLEPVEWGVVKQLADLLERAGQREGAARQFARWADHLFAEGFHAKAAALYKKVLKLDDADEHALWQLGEVSIALKLRGDARVAFQRVVDLRQRRGDEAGAAIARQRRDALEAVTAVPLLPPTLPPAYASPMPPHPVARVVHVPAVPAGAPPVTAPSLTAPTPAVDPEGAFVSDAETGPTSSMALDVLDSWAVPNPDGVPAVALQWSGERAWDDVPKAQVVAVGPEVLEPSTGATAPVVPDSHGRISDGSAFDWANLLGRDVDVAAGPVSTPAVPEPAVTVEPTAVAPVAAATVSDAQPGEVPATATGSQRIGDLRAQPLFEDDAPLQPSFSMPRAWLSDAPAPSLPDMPRRRAPEDDFFFVHDATPPRWAPPPARALATGVTAPPPSPVTVEGAVGESASSAPEPTAPGDRQALEGASGQGSEPAEVGTYDVEDIDEEVDLTQLLEELKQWDPELPEPLPKPMSETPAGISAPAPPLTGPPAVDEVLDAAFADLQRQGDGRAVAEQQLAAGRVFLAAGLASEAARAFERASAEPRARFEAAMALADLHRSRRQLREAVGWYEQAAAAPVPDAAVKGAVLYDLAESLEAIGEPDRAVGVLLDLLSQVEDYRDARARLDRLLRADAGG